jgi:Sap, sulfolipid-1-addressing protein
MLTTVLVMAVAVIFEPVRIGLAVLMLNRPRPVLQLLAFLCGGFTMGLGGGLLVLFIFRAAPLAPRHLTVPKVQIAVGLIALLVAAGIAANLGARKLIHRHPVGAAIGGDAGVLLVEPTPNPGGLARLSTRTWHLLQGRSLRVAGVSGLATALPSANYMGAVAVILVSGAAPVAQAQALLMFNVVAFTLVEIPLVSYLAAPRKTLEVMAAFHAWLQSRPRRNIATLVAAVGVFMLVLGVSGL